MKGFILLLIGALAWGQAPAPDSALNELKARGVIAQDSLTWTAEEAANLKRLRRAERLGALTFLRDRMGTLDGSAVQLETGQGYKRLLLTVRGHERWLFILSQEARAFFEKRGSEAKFVFQITDMDKVRLFTDEGVLTDRGMDLYLAAKRRKRVFWYDTYGRPAGTVRPPAAAPPKAPHKALPPPPSRRPSPPSPEVKPGTMPQTGPVAPPQGFRGPADQAAAARIDSMVRGGALEIQEDEARFLAEASGLSQKDLLEKTTIQAVPADGKMRFFLKPGDPLMEKLAEYRRLKGK